MADTVYVLVADVLGFGRIVHNSSDADLDSRMQAWVHLVESTAATFRIDNFQLISDTLFVSVPSTVEDLATLLDFSRQLMVDGIANSFPIRGAVVHGPIVWGKLTYGRGVIAAHELEQAQNWIGIACDAQLPRVESLWSIDKLVCYPPPLKRAPIRLHPVVSWPVPDADKLMMLLMSGGLTKKGDVITWDLGEKINNTILFRAYLDLLRARGASPATFQGLLPTIPIEAALHGN